MTWANRDARETYLVGGATAPGRLHRTTLTNNQDALYWQTQGSALALAVADGCSSTRAPEVGAVLTARTAVGAALKWAEAHPNELPIGAVDGVFDAVVRMIASVSDAVGGPEHSPTVIADLLLATMLVTLVTPAGAVVFGVGDGVVCCDDMIRVQSAEREGPSYPGYQLHALGILPTVRVFFVRDSTSWRTIALGTDGAVTLSASGGPSDWLDRESRATQGSLQRTVQNRVERASLTSDDDVTFAVVARR